MLRVELRQLGGGELQDAEDGIETAGLWRATGVPLARNKQSPPFEATIGL